MEVAMSFLTLASVTTIAVLGEEDDYSVISSSCWMCILSFFSLLAKLNKNRSEKTSTILDPGINSELREEKDGNTPNNLLFESMRWPLILDFWCSVSALIEWVESLVCKLWGSSMRVLIRCFSGRAAVYNWDLFASFWRWNLIEISPAMASRLSVGEVLKTSRIQMAALLCIFLRIFIGYDKGALLWNQSWNP